MQKITGITKRAGSGCGSVRRMTAGSLIPDLLPV
jgi:hypothetical protein